MKNVFISIWISMYIVLGILCINLLCKPINTEVTNTDFIIKICYMFTSVLSISRAVFLYRIFNSSSKDTY